MIDESTHRLAIDATHLEMIEEYLQLEFNHKLPLNDKNSVFMVFTNGLHFFQLIDKMNDELIESDRINDYTLPSDGLIDGGSEYDDDELQLIRHDESMEKLQLIENKVQSINCGNCNCCMNKDNRFAYCIDKNQSVNDLNDTCIKHERIE